ncbi:rho GTPase-activating protein REN1-like isoform X1 [Phragmites australis]|uniref:rho GTPase-activating protein REN1-like isoform X1 n=1 Tax=Phragmites australis TaxID=29695 RepID=UPI002D775E93|nr:rho GTPase-activating protein REN1-like isoform X1 [Phragmites australis]XP_062233846.1 rho GTPase-activating protein REN1-like isoform X1 [Phragmites australis]
MSASEFRIPYPQVSSSQPAENAGQFKVCRCGEGDPNFTNASETGDGTPTSCPNCQVLKSGHLLLSSKGIGWTSWKKRWFILTRASLVFFRSDPNIPPPRGAEPIVTLGGIDLNNSGSVVVKEERKLLTVLFPDGRDGRTFTLKAETIEDLNDWRSALENALAQAPSVANTVGQNPIFSTDVAEPAEVPAEQSEDNSVVGRPAEFALVDPDGSPSFLEKALKFIEDYGIKVEGILRQSADVEEVKRRLQDYEKGKNEFSPEEDAHVIGDCIKYILREMPSSPVPAAYCTALVGAYRTDKTRRLDEINRVIYEVFPEPNRQLLQRILKMMQIVESHKAVNRMSQSALAACMAPLLLRPLLLGECEIDNDFSMGGDGSFQLLQAAAAANHAQAIVIIMLEEYDRIFDDSEEGSYSSDAYTESEDDDVDKEYSTDNDIHEEDGSYDSGEDDIEEEELDDNSEQSSGGSEYDNNIRTDVTDEKVKNNNAGVAGNANNQAVQPPVKAARTENGASREGIDQISSVLLDSFSTKVAQTEDTSQMEINSRSQPKQESCEPNESKDHMVRSNSRSSSSRAKSIEKASSSANKGKRTLWGRTSARKDLSAEEIDCCSDDETLIDKLESNKTDLQSKITKEVKENGILKASLERRKEELHERRLALEKEVENLRDQLQKERNSRASLESGLMNLRRGQVSLPSTIDSKTKADLEEVATAESDIMNLKQKASDLRGQFNSQQLCSTALCESCHKRLLNTDKLVKYERNASLSPETSSSMEALSVIGCDSVSSMADFEQSRKQTTQHSPSSTDKEKRQQSSNTSSGVTSNEPVGTINQRSQRMQSSKGEIANKDGQEGSSSTSRWNFAQKQYSNSPLIRGLQGSNSVHSSSKRLEESGGGAPAAASALAKLTSRLNFLKERRALLASEMQSLDLGPRPQPQAGPGPGPGPAAAAPSPNPRRA